MLAPSRMRTGCPSTSAAAAAARVMITRLRRGLASAPGVAADSKAALQAAERALAEFESLVQVPFSGTPNGGLYGYVQHQLRAALEATRDASILMSRPSVSSVAASEAERALASLADAAEHTEIAEMLPAVGLAEHEALAAFRDGPLADAARGVERAALRADLHLRYNGVRRAVREAFDGRIAGGDLADLVRPAVPMGTSDWGRAFAVPWAVAKHLGPQRADRAALVWVADPPPPPPPGRGAGPPRGVRVGATARHGRGLFAERGFEPGEVIVQEAPAADVALQGFDPGTAEAATLSQGFLAAALAAAAAGGRLPPPAFAALCEGAGPLDPQSSDFHEAFLEEVLGPLRAAPELARVDRDLYWRAARALARGLHFSSVSDAPPDDEGRPGYRPPPRGAVPPAPVRVLRKRVYPTISMINSSCEPNAASVDVGAVAAARRIEPGEEVLIYYGPGYFSPEHPCTCDRCLAAAAK